MLRESGRGKGYCSVQKWYPMACTVWIILTLYNLMNGASYVVNNPPANTGDLRDVGSIPGWGRSPGGGHGNPLRYSCLENPMDRGAWWSMVHRIAESWKWLKQFGTPAHNLMNTHTHVIGEGTQPYFSPRNPDSSKNLSVTETLGKQKKLEASAKGQLCVCKPPILQQSAPQDQKAGALQGPLPYTLSPGGWGRLLHH